MTITRQSDSQSLLYFVSPRQKCKHDQHHHAECNEKKKQRMLMHICLNVHELEEEEKEAKKT